MIGTSKNIWGFDPRIIPGCALWLDGSDQSSMTISSSSVTQWRDKSGNGYNFVTQGSFAAPVISNNAISSNSAVSFTGNSTQNNSANQILTNASFPLNSSAAGYSIFVVSRQNASHPSYTGYNYLVSAYAGTAGTGLIYGTTFTNFFITANGTAGASSGFNDLSDNIPNTLMTTTNQTSMIVNGSVLTPYFNGVAMTTKTGTCVALTGISIGNAYAPTQSYTGQTWGGIICEILIYNSALTTTQRQQIEGYLGWKWEINSYYNPNLPKTISGCSLWLDGSDPSGNGVIPANGSTISTWTDKSGNGYNATANVGGSAITMGTLNNVPAITFPAASTAAFLLGSSLSVGSGGYSLFFVARQTSFASSGTRIYSGNSGGLQAYVDNGPSPRAIGIYNGGFLQDSFTIIADTPFVFSYVISSGSSGYWKNGISAGTGSGATASISNFYIGNYSEALAAYAFTGQMGEFIIYNTSLTTTQRQSVEDYLSTKWRVSITANPQLPTTHPFYYIRPHLRPFQPLDIDDCIVWLDAADQSTITPSNGGSITAWTDKSGKGNNIINISATAPTYSNADTSVNFSALSSTWLRGNLSTTYSNAATSFAVFSTSQPTQTVSGGVVTTFAGSVGNTGIFYYPYGIATDPSGNVYVGDTYNNRVRKITSGGSVSDFAYGFSLPLGVGYDASTGGLWVADSQYNRVVRFNSGGGATNYYYGFYIPSGVAVDSNGNGYVADTYNNVIKRVSTGGTITTFAGSGTAGSNDGTGTGAQFNNPRALGFDPSQSNLYVCDSANHRIRKIVVSTAVVTTIAGSGTAGDSNGIGTAAQFNYPYGVCSDGSSNLYIAGFVDQRVRKIDLSTNTVTTFAGDSNGYADGFGTAALFKYPSAIGIDSSSNIFVADNNNQLVRKIVISNGTSSVTLTNPRITTLGLSNASTENSLTGQTVVTTSNILNVGSFVATSTNPTGEGSNLQTVLGHGSYNTKLLVATASTYTSPFFSIQSTLNGNNQTNGSAIGSYTADSSYGATYNRYALGSFLNATATSNVSLNGKIFEYLLYSRMLTDSQRQQVESYLAWKWGINSSLSVFTPNNMFGCTIWFDAADSSTVTLNGSNVSSWRDKSGNGYSVGQTTAAYQPTYTSNLLNGLPGIQLSLARYLYQIGTNVPNFSSTAATTVFIVAKNGSSYTASGWNIVSTMWFIGNSGGSARYHFSFGIGGTNGVALYANNAATGATTGIQTTAIALNTNAIIGFTLSAAGSSINVNGSLTSFTTMSATSANDSTWLIFGDARNEFVTDVNIYEFIGFNRDLSTTERERIQGYLSQKWGVGGLSPAPSKYPFTTIPSASVVPFLPTDVLGCRLWLDGNDPIGTGIQPGNGSSISTWVDKSGYSNSPTSSSGTYPTYTSSSRAVTWNGGAAQLTFPTSLHSSVVGTAFTVFFVEQRTIGSENFIIRGTTQATNSNLLIGHGGSLPSTSWRFAFYNNDLDFTGLPTYSAGEPATLSCFVYSDPNRAIYHNGSIVANSTDTNASDLASWTGAMIGGNSIWPAYFGNVFEMLIYNRALSTSERQRVEGYLIWKWGIQLAYQTSTPLSITGCTMWLDGADPAGTGTPPSAGTLATWVDKSGNGRNGIQYSTYARPSFVTNSLNSKGGVSFTAASSNCYQTQSVLPTPGTIFVVGFSSNDGFILSGNPNIISGHPPYYATFARDVEFGINNTSDSAFSANVASTSNTNYILKGLYTGSNVSATMNGGTLSATVSFSGTPKTPALTLIGINSYSGTLNAPLGGTINEFIAYSSALTPSQQQTIELYLANKWGITLSTSFPSPHRFINVSPPSISPTDAAPSFSAVGGSIVIANGFTYHVFVASSSFVATGSRTVNYLFVGGGGGGGDRHGGGGGAGGVQTGTFSATTGTYTVTVGAGGAGGDYEANNSTPRGAGIKGGDTTITGINTALGGGGGGTYDGNPTGSVGSGGGGGGNSLAGVAGTSGQGNAGGTGSNPGGGGGGGAGGAGVNANTGTGGVGTTAHSTTLLAVGYGTAFAVARPPNIVISGGLAYIAGGGGGAAAVGGANGGFGGLGGGGRGDWDNAFISAGTPNTGGGGGAARSENGVSSGFAGGSGLIVLWY